MSSPSTDAQLQPPALRSERVPQLDGFRGVAVALVVIGHASIAVGATQTLPGALLNQGGRGVTIFFVLSGFLITTILLREREKSGTISLSAFYKRRAFRILPAFYTYLAVAGILALSGVIELKPWEWIASATFVWDYVSSGNWWVGHTWSLAVEEQFYLLWPLALLLVAIRRVRVVAIVVVCVLPVVRTAEYLLLPASRPTIGITFHTRADALLLGALLALSVGTRFWERLGRIGKRAWPLATAYLFVIAPLATYIAGGAYFLTVGWTIEQLLIALLICTVVTHPETVLARVLGWRPLVAIGLISYSLYLWQQIYLAPQNPELVHAPYVGIPLAILTATVSYWLIEKPFLRLKKKYERSTVDFHHGA